MTHLNAKVQIRERKAKEKIKFFLLLVRVSISFSMNLTPLDKKIKKESRTCSSNSPLLYERGVLPQIFHQNLGITTIAKLSNAFLANLANTFTGESQLVANLLETFLVATYTKTFANDSYFPHFQHFIKH